MVFTPSHLRKATFTRALKGYHINDVDAFFGIQRNALSSEEKLPSVSEARFRITLNGYDVREVDSYLLSLSWAMA